MAPPLSLLRGGRVPVPLLGARRAHRRRDHPLQNGEGVRSHRLDWEDIPSRSRPTLLGIKSSMSGFKESNGVMVGGGVEEGGIPGGRGERRDRVGRGCGQRRRRTTGRRSRTTVRASRSSPQGNRTPRPLETDRARWHVDMGGGQPRGGGSPSSLIPTPPLAAGQVNKWQEGRAPPKLLNTRCEFQRTVRIMVGFFCAQGGGVLGSSLAS